MTAFELQLAEEVFAQVNAERAAVGLAPLAWRDDVAEVSYQHSIWQRDVNGGLSHDGPGNCVNPPGQFPCGVNRLAAVGLDLGPDYSALGENVAQGQMTMLEVMCGPFGWMNSAGHQENILDSDFTHIGVAVAWGAPGPMWTQMFLRIP
jgi:uncharacterized protein YkwD